MHKRTLELTFVLALAAGMIGAPFVSCAQTNDPNLVGRRFVELVSKEDFPGAFALFSERLKGLFPEVELQKSWEDVLDQVGGFKQALNVEWRGENLCLTCQFALGKREVKLSFNSHGEIKSILYSQPDLTGVSLGMPAYADTNAFHERDFTVVCGKWSLPGTLTLPDGAGPWPAVVLVHGSGPNDRDFYIGANRPFRDLAWGLATHGVAVLRYDKRTKIYGVNAFTNAARFTVQEEVIDDAVAAAAQLRREEGIDPKRVFVAGHSLGGTVAPRIGQADPQLAGLIILAGSTRRYEDLISEQEEYMLSLDGPMSARDKAQLASVQADATRIKNFTAADVTSPVTVWRCPPSYWLDLDGYNPVAVARTLRMPIFILQGARDYQVTTVDFDGWKAGLGTQMNVAFRLYPNLNHLFIAGEGKSTPMEYDEPGHVEERVVTDMSGWIRGIGPANVNNRGTGRP